MNENGEKQEIVLMQIPAFRVGLVLIIVLVSFFSVRQLFIPQSFGQYGYFRGSNVDEWVTYEAGYVDEQACAGCHAQRVAELSEAKHGQFSCQTCHGAGGKHAADPGAAKLAIKPSRDFCGRCHNQIAGRSEDDIKQVPLGWHYAGLNCVKCHDPHEPFKQMKGW